MLSPRGATGKDFGPVQGQATRPWPGTDLPTAEEARAEWERRIAQSPTIPTGTSPTVSCWPAMHPQIILQAFVAPCMMLLPADKQTYLCLQGAC